MFCATCGSERMRLTKEPVTVEYRGESFVMDGYEHWRCDQCGETAMGPAEATRLNRAVRAMWAEEHGYDPLTPREIRKLRKSLGMTQAEFETALGLRPPTVSRWENGKVTPSPTADLLMRSLARDAAARRTPTFTMHEGGRSGGHGPYRLGSGGDDYAMEG